VNVWLIGATVLLVGLLPCLWLGVRGSASDALVGLELAGTLVAVVLLLLAEGFHRPAYFVLPLIASVLAFVGVLVFVRFLGERHL
jgi:multisubunit Na+/H+ antiporter MnhF subunit